MRWLLLVAVVALSGCMSQTSVEAPNDCLFFCQEHEATVHFDWVAPVLVLLFMVLVTGIIVAVAAGGRGGDQQQQVVVHVERDGEVRRPAIQRQR